jgi:hypothetical protein
MQKSTIAFVAIIVFFLLLFLITTVHNYDTSYESFKSVKSYRSSPFYRMRATDLYVHSIDENWKNEIVAMHDAVK